MLTCQELFVVRYVFCPQIRIIDFRLFPVNYHYYYPYLKRIMIFLWLLSSLIIPLLLLIFFGNLSVSNSPFFTDLSQHTVHNVQECEQLMDKGWKNRATGATLMNSDSSRSHSIFTIQIETLDLEGHQHIRRGKLNLVDLAGSERQAKTGATGDRLKEATKINLSISALGNVISALVDGKSKHIPYRDSKLTRLLQDSLGGNTKTLMVACVSPADNNYDETLSTLRYANRAKNIKNKPRINQDPKDALLSQYQEEIRQLKELLEKNGGAGNLNNNVGALSDLDLEEEREKIRREYENQIRELRQNYENEREGRARLEQDVESLKKEKEKDLTQEQVQALER